MNVQDIINISKERKRKDKDSIKKILDNIHKKIKFYANLNKESCTYQIPPIINEKPVYNIDSITKEIFKVLDSEGFVVTAYSDGNLDIFWNEKLIEQKVKTDAYLISQKEKKIKNLTNKAKNIDAKFEFIANPKKTAKSIDDDLDLQVQKILDEKNKLQKKYYHKLKE
jgi:hypothetical protein